MWKYLLALGLLLGALYTSYWYGKKSNPPIEKIVTVEVDKKKEKTSIHTKTTTKPDGTKIEEKTETTESESETAVSHKKDTKTKVLSKYKIGIMAETDKFQEDAIKYSATASMRAYGPWWIDAKYEWKSKTVGLGVSVEF